MRSLLALSAFLLACDGEPASEAADFRADEGAAADAAPVDGPARASEDASIPGDWGLDPGPDSAVDAEADAAPTASQLRLAPGPHLVGVRTLTLVDSSRTTPANMELPEEPARTLVTEVWYPAEAAEEEAAPKPGPFPLVVHGHGFMSGRRDSPGLGTFLASHGFIVAAPDFPRTNRGVQGGVVLEDSIEQPADLHFVIDSLLADARFAIDAERIALSGVSLGGFTALAAGLLPELPIARIKAIVGITPATCFLPVRVLESTTPLMVLHGDHDAILDYATHAEAFYARANPPKALVRMAGGTHTGFVDATARALSALPHADTLGCMAIAGELPEARELPEEVLDPECAPACPEGFDFTGGLNPVRQNELLWVSLHAFLLAVLDEEEAAETFLRDHLGPDNEELELRSEGLLE